MKPIVGEKRSDREKARAQGSRRGLVCDDRACDTCKRHRLNSEKMREVRARWASRRPQPSALVKGAGEVGGADPLAPEGAVGVP